MPEGINDFLRAQCFTFSTVAQTWSVPTDLPGISATEIGTDYRRIRAGPKETGEMDENWQTVL
jgi:hypothetical protein